MKKDTEKSTQNDANSGMTHHQKYHGLIKRSSLKNFRDHLFQYFDFIYTMGSSYQIIVNIFRNVIIFQQVMMVFVPFDTILWPKDSLLGRIFAVLSVPAFICPSSVGSMANFVVVLIIYVILLLFYIIFFSNLYIFLKMSKVDSIFVSMITIYLNVLQPYLINMISSNLGRDFFYMIENDHSVPHIITFILGLIFLSLLVIFQSFFVAPSLTFRPQVTHIMYTRISLEYNFCYIFIFFLATLGGLKSGLAGLIISMFLIIPAVFMIFISFRQHYWANNHSMCMSQAFSIMFIATSIVAPILSYKEIQANEAIFLVLIVFETAFIFIFEFLAEKNTSKLLDTLNDIENDESLAENISRSKMISLLRYGFEHGHVICHNWKLFRIALNKYPFDYCIVLMYARYAAIYSGESIALRSSERMLKHMKHGSIELKYVLFQVHSLLQHRERGLSTSLKKMLSKIQDKTEKCRGLIRYTFECVIRGNTGELENLTMQSKRIEEEILREYNQLYLVYPNNPHVALAFSTFASEIMCNEKEASEKMKIYNLLRTGAWTRTERSYYFAIRHFRALPTEHDHSAMSSKVTAATSDFHSYASATSGVGKINDLDDNEENLKTQKRYIESMIKSVKLPTTRYGPILIFFAVCIILPVIIIPELIVIHTRMVSDEESLDVIQASALINLYMAHLSFYTFQYGMSTLGFTSTIKEKWEEIYRKENIKEYFINKDPQNMLQTDQEYLLECIETLRVILNYFNNKIPQFAITKYFEQPIACIFDNGFYTRLYNATNKYTTNNASIEHIVVTTQGSALQIAYKTEKEDILDNPSFWSVIKNGPKFFEQYDVFQNMIINSIQEMFDDHTKNIQIMVFVSLFIALVVVILSLIFLVRKMEKEKTQLFESFKSIPKASISTIVQQLNAQSGKDKAQNENESEVQKMSAQEENALRILSTSVDHGIGLFSKISKIMFLFLIYLIMAILSIIFLAIVPNLHNNDLVHLAPLYHEIASVHNLFMVVFLGLNRNILTYEGSENPYTNFPYHSYLDDYMEIGNLTDDIVKEIHQRAYMLRYGNQDIRSNGITFVGDALINLLIRHDHYDYIIPEEDVSILELSSYDVGLEYVNRLFSKMVVNIQSQDYIYLSSPQVNLATIWLIQSSYKNYIIPSFYALGESIISRGNKYRTSQLLIPIIIFVVIMIICGIAIIPIYISIGENAQWSLKLLMFCDPNVVLQSKVILKILSSDFSENESSKNQDKANFYETVVANLLDGVIFMSNDLTIRSANNSVKSVIGKEPEEIIGMSLNDIFEYPPGKEASLRSFYQAVEGMMNCMRSPSIECEVDVMKGGEPVTLLLSLTAISSAGEVQLKPVNSDSLAIIVLSMKDMTSTVVARTLLQEENEKSENLLSMILPPIIVNKLQKGEQSICFSVQSASIVFMDIVSFTPWCGSNKAAYIMSTLNKLFLYFDTELKKLDKMTKIKCIGDCYMCAGGIFDEVNQPADHAMQAITFGLEAIRCVRRIDVELNESLRIRVGCNTGGPIVAGILGIEKPTFDILGPDINLGAMMEHHGVPMNVHIPQHVYDLGVSDHFVVKERGDVDVKGKMYHTYIVSDYLNKKQ